MGLYRAIEVLYRAIEGYIGLYWGYIGIMEKKMETAICPLRPQTVDRFPYVSINTCAFLT